jgi:hypothetical protein
MIPVVAGLLSSAASSAASNQGGQSGGGLMGMIGGAANAPSRILGLGIQAFAAAKQAKELRKQQKALDAQKRFNEIWYGGEMSKDYFSSDEARSSLKMAQDSIKKNIGRIQGAGAITGMSDEATVANNASGMDALGNFATNLAGRADQRKDRVQGTYFNRRGDLENRQAGIDQGRVDKWSNLSANATNMSEAFNVIPSGQSSQAAAPAQASNPNINIDLSKIANSPQVDAAVDPSKYKGYA